MPPQDLQPSIRFGGEDIPAHQVWPKTKLLYGVNEFLARINEQMPEFATDETIAVVVEVRRRLKSIEVAMPRRFQPTPEMEKDARELLKPMSVEEALERFNTDHQISMSISDFVELIGSRTYYDALREEAREWEINKILPSQTAEIWNEQDRPAPGDAGEGWNAQKIERLLRGDFT